MTVIKEASILLFQPPTVQGFGNTSGFEVIVQDRMGGPLDKLGEVTNGFIGELFKRP
jgi:HAE1 family hydrophobic/amphiphilic exporter-1